MYLLVLVPQDLLYVLVAQRALGLLSLLLLRILLLLSLGEVLLLERLVRAFLTFYVHHDLCLLDRV